MPLDRARETGCPLGTQPSQHWTHLAVGTYTLQRFWLGWQPRVKEEHTSPPLPRDWGVWGATHLRLGRDEPLSVRLRGRTPCCHEGGADRKGGPVTQGQSCFPGWIGTYLCRGCHQHCVLEIQGKALVWSDSMRCSGSRGKSAPRAAQAGPGGGGQREGG